MAANVRDGDEFRRNAAFKREMLPFLEGKPHPAFELRRLALGPGKRHAYDPREWQDSLVVVERGEVELECLSGACRSFSGGDILWLAGLPIRALHNHGNAPAVVVAVRRRKSLNRAMSPGPPPRYTG
jgi:hypothetical protein